MHIPRRSTPRLVTALLAAAPGISWGAPGAASSAADGRPAAVTAADDRGISVGLWDVVAVEMNGRELDPGLVTLLQVAYRADGSWAVLFKGLPLAEGTSSNDQDAAPKTFEIETLAGGNSEPRRYSGIYRIDDESRMLCFVDEGQPRPEAFSAPRGSGRVLATLRRAATR